MTQVAVLRAMQQLSEVYSVMTIASLSELVPFFGFSQVEQIIVDAVKQGYLQVQARTTDCFLHCAAAAPTRAHADYDMLPVILQSLVRLKDCFS